MTLDLVIEISPKKYSEKGIEYQDKYIDNEITFEKYWDNCLKNSLLENIKPIKSKTFLIDTSTITDEQLALILDTEFETLLEQKITTFDWEKYLDEGIYIHGGVILKKDNEVLIQPTCCVDFGDIQNWFAIENAKNSWSQLWIGHPWVFYRKNGQFIEFTDYTEDSSTLKTVKHQFKIDRFFATLTDFKSKLLDFEKRIERILTMLDVKNPSIVAKQIIGNPLVL